MLRLYDNTRTSCAKSCLRKYYFRHVRHWEPTSKKTALVFGGAWHKAMEVVWPGLIDGALDLETLVNLAYGEFIKEWTAAGFPDHLSMEEEKDFQPRTPGNAMEMLIEYCHARKDIKRDFELVAIEQPFAVPLSPNDPTLFYVGKIDKIVRRRGKMGGIEHKTTTAYSKGASPFRSSFSDSFSPNAQVDGYLYALHMNFPDNVFGIWVDGALVHKQEQGFIFIPIEKKLDALDAWLWDTHYWIAAIEQEKERLASMVNQGDSYMAAFPKNTNSCWDFNVSCPYLDLCKAWPNPHGKPIPNGFTESVWDPLKEIPKLEGLIGGGA